MDKHVDWPVRIISNWLWTESGNGGNGADQIEAWLSRRRELRQSSWLGTELDRTGYVSAGPPLSERACLTFGWKHYQRDALHCGASLSGHNDNEKFNTKLTILPVQRTVLFTSLPQWRRWEKDLADDFSCKPAVRLAQNIDWLWRT